MAQKKKLWIKEVKSGLLLAAIVCAALFILLLLSCFDLYTLSHLKLNQAKMYADKVYRQESLHAEALFDQGELDARKDFLNTYHPAVVEFNHACSGGIRAYWTAFGNYWHNYLLAREVYNIRVEALTKRSAAIRANARKEGEEIIKQARNEIDPLFLIFKGKLKGKILGYLYDPALGKLEPQVGLINRGKALDEKKK